MPNEPLVFSVNGLCHSFTPASTATLLFRNTNVSDWIVSEVETERQTCGVQGAGEGCHCVLGKRDSAAGERDDAVRGELHCAVFLRIGDIRDCHVKRDGHLRTNLTLWNKIFMVLASLSKRQSTATSSETLSDPPAVTVMVPEYSYSLAT